LEQIRRIQRFTYDPLIRSRGIRLLKIKPGFEYEPIECELFEASLDDNPAYEALSYTWRADRKLDDSSKEKERLILCNGKVLGVQENLYDALIEFRCCKRPFPFWIDRICIDQEDLKHKFAQIEMMGTIYASARCVVIWLGRSSMVQEVALNIIAKFASSEMSSEADAFSLSEFTGLQKYRPALATSIEDPAPASSLKDRLFQQADAAVVADTLSRGWFSRTWTLQELLLAKDIEIRLGGREIDPVALVNSAKWLLELYSTDALAAATALGDDNVSWVNGHLVSIPAFFNSRKDFIQGTRWSLEEYAAIVRTRAVTEPRDKVFASYSLLTINLPHVTGTTAHIYTDYALALLHSNTGLLALSLVGDQKSSITDLPTWVPDLCVPLKPKPLMYLMKHSFRAASSTSGLQKLSVTEGTLLLKAARFDIISMVGESYYFQNRDKSYKSRYPESILDDILGRMLEIATSLGKTYQHTGEPTLSVLCQTLLAGFYSNGSCPIEVIRGFLGYFAMHYYYISKVLRGVDRAVDFLTIGGRVRIWSNDILKLWMEDLHRLPDRCGAFIDCHDSPEYPVREVFEYWQKWASDTAGLSYSFDLMKQVTTNGKVYESFQPFFAHFSNLFDYKRIFSTANGYMGSGVYSLQKGDVVVLFAGANVPYLLRPIPNKENTFSLIGEAYVHGIMGGEGVKCVEGLWEMISLV
jgi:hypothetical protein